MWKEEESKSINLKALSKHDRTIEVFPICIAIYCARAHFLIYKHQSLICMHFKRWWLISSSVFLICRIPICLFCPQSSRIPS